MIQVHGLHPSRVVLPQLRSGDPHLPWRRLALCSAVRARENWLSRAAHSTALRCANTRVCSGSPPGPIEQPRTLSLEAGRSKKRHTPSVSSPSPGALGWAGRDARAVGHHHARDARAGGVAGGGARRGQARAASVTAQGGPEGAQGVHRRHRPVRRRSAGVGAPHPLRAHVHGAGGQESDASSCGMHASRERERESLRRVRVWNSITHILEVAGGRSGWAQPGVTVSIEVCRSCWERQ
jgi:hypothetical protein